MAYTAVELQVTTGPVLALYTEDDNRVFTARPVYAFAIYRDTSASGEPNYLIPLTSLDFSISQLHSYVSEREVKAVLPIKIVERQDWWDIAQETTASSVVIVLDAEQGFVARDAA